MKTVRSIPQYTTILSQAMSPCGQLYVSATVDGYIGVWRVSELFTTDASPFVRQGYFDCFKYLLMPNFT